MSAQEDYLKGIADAIREKEGSSGMIPANAFAQRIKDLPTFSGTGIPSQLSPIVVGTNFVKLNASGILQYEFITLTPNYFPYLVCAIPEVDGGGSGDMTYGCAIILYNQSSKNYDGQYFESSGIKCRNNIASIEELHNTGSGSFMLTWNLNPNAERVLLDRKIYVTVYEGIRSV